MRLTDPAAMALWLRLQAFELDPPGLVRTISDRVALEQGWSAAYTRRVVEEYRRFLLLTQVAGRRVSPSRAVDAVWHTHLLYSRDYWDRLCGQVLGRTLHHDPNPGGPDHDAHHQTQYHDTLAAYERVFGEAPPADLWTHSPADPAWSLAGLSEAHALKAKLMAGEFRPSLLALLRGGEPRVTATALAGLHQRGLLGFAGGQPVLSKRMPEEHEALTSEEWQVWRALRQTTDSGQPPKLPLSLAYPELVQEAIDAGLRPTPPDHAQRVAKRRTTAWRSPLRLAALAVAALLSVNGVWFHAVLIVLWWGWTLQQAYADTEVQPTDRARQLVDEFIRLVPAGTSVSLGSPLLATVVAAGVIGGASAADLGPLQSAIVPGRQEGGGCGGGGGCSGGSGGGDGGGDGGGGGGGGSGGG
ncbi:hypothetical protein [uncultured Sphaerotilus sp.]|uniref:glycine-rich domain-containing protein n=1 Tax=uncultured Sphaerotilus sp. TaxID=474984 RepID=UPI0030CA5834